MADDTIKFDLRDFERAAKRMGAAIDQVPYALKNVMNDAAFATRQYLSNDVWPGHLMQRNKRFPAVALNVDKATKTNLSVSIFDRLGRGNLLAHAKGGTARPRTGKLA